MAYNRWLSSNYLEHHGVKGQQWGVTNGPPYPLDRSKSDGHKLIAPSGSAQTKKRRTVFISGSSKTQDEGSGYFRKDLPKEIQKQIDVHIKKGNRIIVGDAPGIDRQVQDYLKSKHYRNVGVYGPGKEVRYAADSRWKTFPIDDPDHEPGSKEWLAKKDVAMTEAADEGIAIILDEGAKATRRNVQRLYDSGKGVRVYSLNKDGSDAWEDDWVEKWGITSDSRNYDKANDIYKTLSRKEKRYLMATGRFELTPKEYVRPGEYDIPDAKALKNWDPKNAYNVYSRIEQYRDVPVSVIDIWGNNDGRGAISIATRGGNSYRHQGYASRALEKGIKYFYDDPKLEYLVWGVNKKNRPSIELAKKYGFEWYNDYDDNWESYILEKKR